MTTTVGIIGSTGSIGTQTLDILDVGRSADNTGGPVDNAAAATGSAEEIGDYHVVALAAGSDVATLLQQVEQWKPRYVAIGDESKTEALRDAVPASTEVLAGPSAMADIAEVADVTVNGVVGFAGLPVTLSCLRAGKRLALANKESLIAAGPVVQQARRTPGAELVPVDSEHVAIHQCLRANDVVERVSRLQLTASGGPFRGRARGELATVSIEDALAHPTWSMGPKITIDSSTLMNKGLEVIEANELFGVPAGDGGFGIGFDEIEVVVHPQSIIHSMVTYSDGSTIAQLSHPDMRLPIGYALAYPDRFPVPYGRIDWTIVRSTRLRGTRSRGVPLPRSGLCRGPFGRHGSGVAQRGQRGRGGGLPRRKDRLARDCRCHRVGSRGP